MLMIVRWRLCFQAKNIFAIKNEKTCNNDELRSIRDEIKLSHITYLIGLS